VRHIGKIRPGGINVCWNSNNSTMQLLVMFADILLLRLLFLEIFLHALPTCMNLKFYFVQWKRRAHLNQGPLLRWQWNGNSLSHLPSCPFPFFSWAQPMANIMTCMQCRPHLSRTCAELKSHLLPGAASVCLLAFSHPKLEKKFESTSSVYIHIYIYIHIYKYIYI